VLEIRSRYKKVTELEVAELALGEPDSSGRVASSEKSRSAMPIDFVLLELDRVPDLGILGDSKKVRKTFFNTLSVNPETLETGLQGVFAGGDMVSGPKSMIEAVAHGRRAARSIARFLHAEAGEPEKKPVREYVRYEIRCAPAPEQRVAPSSGMKPRASLQSQAELDLKPEGVDAGEPVNHLPGPEKSASQAPAGYEENEAVREAARCLRCGSCGDCIYCSPQCSHWYAALPSLGGLLLRGEGKMLASLEAGQGTVTHAEVDPDRCKGCGRCEEVCGSHAPRVVPSVGGDRTAVINPNACRSCGCCAAQCPSGAIRHGYFTAQWLRASVVGKALEHRR